MQSVGITSHTTPSEYQLLDLSRPEIKDPHDVLIKAHAASVNPVDLKKAEGVFKMALKESYVNFSLSLKIFNIDGPASHTKSATTQLELSKRPARA